MTRPAENYDFRHAPKLSRSDRTEALHTLCTQILVDLLANETKRVGGCGATLMGESVTTPRLRPVIPISGAMILQGVAQKLVIVGRGIRLLAWSQNQEVTANR